MEICVHRVRRPARGLLVLAVIALSFLLVRPVCAAWATGSDDHEPCCTSMDDAASVAPAAVKMPEAKAPLAVAPPSALRWLAVKRPLPGAAPPRASPPRPLDYHARCARILS